MRTALLLPLYEMMLAGCWRMPAHLTAPSRGADKARLTFAEATGLDFVGQNA